MPHLMICSRFGFYFHSAGCCLHCERNRLPDIERALSLHLPIKVKEKVHALAIFVGVLSGDIFLLPSHQSFFFGGGGGGGIQTGNCVLSNIYGLVFHAAGVLGLMLVSTSSRAEKLDNVA